MLKAVCVFIDSFYIYLISVNMIGHIVKKYRGRCWIQQNPLFGEDNQFNFHAKQQSPVCDILAIYSCETILTLCAHQRSRKVRARLQGESGELHLSPVLSTPLGRRAESDPGSCDKCLAPLAHLDWGRLLAQRNWNRCCVCGIDL